MFLLLVQEPAKDIEEWETSPRRRVLNVTLEFFSYRSSRAGSWKNTTTSRYSRTMFVGYEVYSKGRLATALLGPVSA